MAYNESLVNKVREALMHSRVVEEKPMFQGLTFMVDDKMCVGIREDEIMFRVNPKVHDEVIERVGCRQMIHGKRLMKGFIFVNEAGYKSKSDFDFWLQLALDYNKIAKPSKKRKKK